VEAMNLLARLVLIQTTRRYCTATDITPLLVLCNLVSKVVSAWLHTILNNLKFSNFADINMVPSLQSRYSGQLLPLLSCLQGLVAVDAVILFWWKIS
jgi:hypothetical protein